MSFFWIIIILIAIILIAMDPRTWGQWAREGWTDLGAQSYERRSSDIEVRAEYRRRDYQHIPYVKQGAIIIFPDPVLDRLIFDERFDEADKYRIEQTRLARERRDGDALQTYMIYKTIFSTAMVRADERTRRELRKKYPKLKRKPMEILPEPGYRTGILQTTLASAVKMIRSRFLEIESKDPVVRPLLRESRKPIGLKTQDTGEEADKKDEGEYDELISI